MTDDQQLRLNTAMQLLATIITCYPHETPEQWAATAFQLADLMLAKARAP